LQPAVRTSNLSNQEKRARLFLANYEGISCGKFLKILEKFGSALTFLNNFSYIKISPEKRAILEKLDENEYFVYGETVYPKLLSEINDPPIVLYYKGDLNLLQSSKTISVVGTRNHSYYGAKATKLLVEDFVLNGFIIVSGLAKGIDLLAHQTAINSHGKTIAVLGTKLTDFFPQSNKKVYEEILTAGGLLLTEYYTDPYADWNFPKRNRIIAGLSMKTIVVEAPEKSGALITANMAFHYNREVWVVPGEITNLQCLGSNKLIYDNKAQIIYNSSQIFAEDNIKDNQPKLDISSKILITANLSEPETRILELIRNRVNTLERIVSESEYERDQVTNLLTKLELRAIILKDLTGTYLCK